jgi:hypothetical protein
MKITLEVLKIEQSWVPGQTATQSVLHASFRGQIISIPISDGMAGAILSENLGMAAEALPLPEPTDEDDQVELEEQEFIGVDLRDDMDPSGPGPIIPPVTQATKLERLRGIAQAPAARPAVLKSVSLPVPVRPPAHPVPVAAALPPDDDLFPAG